VSPTQRRAPVLRAFGAALRQIRERSGLSQEDLAHRADLHRTYVSSVERGERNVGLLNIVAVAEALNVEPGRLLANMPGSKSLATSKND